MSSAEILNTWATNAGIDKNTLEDNGRVCSFLFNDDLPVSVEAPAYSDDVFIVIELCKAGIGEIRRKRLSLAMQLNAYALETRGGVIGWDTVGERIIISYRTSAQNTDATMLDNVILNLVEVAETIKVLLEMREETEKSEQIDQGFDNMFKPITP